MSIHKYKKINKNTQEHFKINKFIVKIQCQ